MYSTPSLSYPDFVLPNRLWFSSKGVNLELMACRSAEVEIAYFGLLPAFYGRGFGGALLTYALEEAWPVQTERVWVYTCTEDHPAALASYQARGLRVYKVETRSYPVGSDSSSTEAWVRAEAPNSTIIC